MSTPLRDLGLAAIAAFAFLTAPVADASSGLGVAIVAENAVALRASPREAAPQQALLWQGEVLEVRAERMDYLQVYDYKRERGGYVRATQVRRTMLAPDDASALLSVLRFLRDKPEAEALAIGYAMAYVQAAPVDAMRGAAGIEALDALGTAAERLAQRASSPAPRSKATETTIAAHLDVAARYGVTFASHERGGRMQLCYDGDAFRRVLALHANPVQRARAVLALTRADCLDPDLSAADRRRREEQHAALLDRVELAELPGMLANRIALRRTLVWTNLAFARARQAEPTVEAASRALGAFTAVRKSELADEDLVDYNDAAMRASAARWAAQPGIDSAPLGRLVMKSRPGEPGETCIMLTEPGANDEVQLARRCTFGIAWISSAQINREQNAVVIAVQPNAGWMELWVFRKEAKRWLVRVLPPAATLPETGYAEWAGWVPGGAQMLVAREARGEGRYRRRFEVVHLDTLATGQEAREPDGSALFKRWQSAQWRTATLSVR